jgi:hypothetical protein
LFGLRRQYNVNIAKQYGSYEEFRKDHLSVGTADNQIREYFERRDRIAAGRLNEFGRRSDLNATRALRGQAGVKATEERTRATMLPGYLAQKTRTESEIAARNLEEQEAQKQDLADYYTQLRETPEGADFEAMYNNYREQFRRQRSGHGAMDSESLYGAQEMMFRMTGRRLGFTDLEGAFSAAPGSERYQRAIVSGASTLMSREDRLQQQAEFQYQHPNNAVMPRDPRELRFDAALRNAQSASRKTELFANTVGTYLAGVLNFQDKLQLKIEELEKKVHTREADAQIPHTR